jgi:signal transduction histidine kinase/CheY-like chemotaxis protein
VELRQQQMEKLAKAAPMNFFHKYELVEAEKARVLGHNDRAMESYDRAIQAAREYGFIQEEALAAELAAEFYFHRGRDRVAKDYLSESYNAYLRWGATAKVEDLLNRYPQVFSPPIQRTLTLEDRQESHTTKLGSTSFDLATIMKATQAISDEIVLDKLLDKLMNRLIENAGARTGSLLLQSAPSELGKAERWLLVAEGFVERDNLIMLPGQPFETRLDLPLALINYVIRSRSPLVLSDATHEGLFTNDAYILNQQPKSVLCLPIIYQSKLKGILYLENNLTKGAFTQEHLEVLNLLSAQAAISLENAALYRTLQAYSHELENKNQSLEAEIQQRRQVEQEREQLLVREQAARMEAEDANRIKDEFLAILSHELRTPLGPILGWVQFLRTRKLDRVATDRALETIERNAKLQTKLIEDLLDISRILQGKLRLDVYSVDLAATITAAIETVRLAAHAKTIELQTYLDPSIGSILGDSARLQQIVWNLVSNAIKFTPHGGRVDIHLERSETQAQIRVSDTGKGISRDFLPFVFDVFRQADSATTRQFGGLGLGLAIVRRLVELHGGTVAVDSPGEGQGTSFIVRIPLMSLALPQPEDKQLLSAALNLEGIKILIVDDEADMREFAVFLLEQYGAQVTAAASALEALAAIAQVMPDVLISDIGMPDMNGYMLMQQVRTQFPEGKQIRSLALSAYAGEINQQQALAAGFQQHIAKPVEPEALVKAITALVTSQSAIKLT